jgi:copper oxidase (laccase) domain-containing protein
VGGRFAALDVIGAVHLVTTRQGPEVRQVRREPAVAAKDIARVLGLEDAAFLEQVHGGDVLVCERGGCAGFADGLVTAEKGLMLMGKSGDCPIVC